MFCVYNFKMKNIIHLTVFIVYLYLFSQLKAAGIKFIPPPISPPGTYSSYQLGPVCKSYGPIHTPKNIQQILNLVKFAKNLNKKIKAFGHRHSMTDIICTDGIAIDMSLIKGIKMNTIDKTVTASAGVTLRELGEFLHLNGRSLQIIPAFGEITIGGALGTGSHGSSLKYESTLAMQAISVKIINGIGQIKNIWSSNEMRAYRNHLGMLGIILEVTFKTVPSFKIHVHNYETSDDILTNGIWEIIAKSSDSFFMYWFPSQNTVIISNGTFVNVNTPGNSWTNDHVPPTSQLFNSVLIPTSEIFQQFNIYSGLSLFEKYMQKTLTVQMPFFVPIYTEDGQTVQNPAIGYSYKMLASVCSENYGCPWFHYPFNMSMIDNELSMDIKYMKKLVYTIKDILSKSPATFPLQGILMRFSKSANTYMSNSNGRDTVHLEWYSVKRTHKNQYNKPMYGMTAYQVIMQAMAFTFGGRSHWGKSGLIYNSRGIIHRNIEKQNLESFINHMKIADPNQIFMNNFGKRLLNISDYIDIDPKTKHCAILDNCICSLHNDCAPGQFCGTIHGYPKYNACINLDQ